MLNGILQIPKIPILLLNGHTNSSIWSKDPKWNYEISAYIRIPSISAPRITFLLLIFFPHLVENV